VQHDGVFEDGQVNAVESVQDLLKNASIEWEIFGNESLPPSVHWFATLVVFSAISFNLIKNHLNQVSSDLRSIVGKIRVAPRLDIAQPSLHDYAERLVVRPILDTT
jgi:hypothetical protein